LDTFPIRAPMPWRVWSFRSKPLPGARALPKARLGKLANRPHQVECADETVDARMSRRSFDLPRSRSHRTHFNRALAGWFPHHKRAFPWRRTEDPYRILIAEMLLRMTRAEAVVPVYRSIIRCWPSVAAMARADSRKVAGEIAPIGLPNRGRDMREASRIMLKKHDGVVPKTKADLIALPGVGDYVANAVLCFGYGMTVPLVDGGVGRVLRRAFGLKRGPPVSMDSAIWHLADDLLPSGNAKLHNWALLDLAGTVCRPLSPLCSSCPLRGMCAARAHETRNYQARDQVDER
jgi:A/G-specific adenine glycosylase